MEFMNKNNVKEGVKEFGRRVVKNRGKICFLGGLSVGLYILLKVADDQTGKGFAEIGSDLDREDGLILKLISKTKKGADGIAVTTHWDPEAWQMVIDTMQQQKDEFMEKTLES